MYANQKTVTLGNSSMEITPEPAGFNTPELIPRRNISGVHPVRFQTKPSPPDDQYWTYRFNSITVVRIYINDGRKFDIELQEITNQSTWSLGTLAALQQAVEDINVWLASGVIPPPTPVYPTEEDAALFIARLVDGVPLSQENLIRSFLLRLKLKNGIRLTAGGLAEAMDYDYWFGSLVTENNAKLNVVKNAFPITTVGSPTWANTGYTGGTGKYGKNGFVSSTDAEALKLNDAFIYIWVNTDTGSVSEGEMGVWDDGNGVINTSLSARYNGSATGQINVPNNSTEAAFAVASAIGLTALERRGNTLRIYKNGAMIYSTVVAPSALAAFEDFFMCYNYAAANPLGFPLRYSNRELERAGKGASTFMDQPELYDAIVDYRNGVNWAAKPILSTIFTDAFARGAVGSNYTVTGAGSFTCNGTNLVATNTSGGQWDKRIEYTKSGYYTCLEKSDQVVNVAVDSTSSKGIAVGLLGIYNDLAVAFRFDTGNIEFYNKVATTPNLLATSASSLSVSAGHDLEITLNDFKGSFTMRVVNVTTGNDLVWSYSYGLTYSQTNIRPCCATPVIYAIGGTQNISLWEFSSNAEKNADLMLIGDSNFFGFYADYQSNSIGNRIGRGKYYNLYGGPGLKTADINWTEAASLVPQKVVINLGTNDQYLSVPNATSIANLTAGIAILEAAGITVKVCQIPPITSVNVTQYNTDLVTAFGARVGPDLFSLFVGTGTDFDPTYSPDGIHIGPNGQELAKIEIENNI